MARTPGNPKPGWFSDASAAGVETTDVPCGVAVGAVDAKNDDDSGAKTIVSVYS